MTNHLLIPLSSHIGSCFHRCAAQVQFLWVQSFWLEHRITILQLVVGVTGLVFYLSMLLWRNGCGYLRQYFWFTPSSGQEHLHRRVVLMCMAWIVPSILLLFSLYSFQDCTGKPMQQCIESALDTDGFLWGFVLVACCFAAMCGSEIVVLKKMVKTHYAVSDAKGCCSPAAGLLWFILLAVLSWFPFLYAAGGTLPADNTLSIPADALTLVHLFGGAILSFINSVVIPKLARELAKRCDAEDTPLATQLILVARILIVIVLPTAAMIYLNDSCYSGWLHLWSPCASPINFEIGAPITTEQFTSPGCDSTFGNCGFTADFWLPITKHNEVCEPPYVPGRCSRDVLVGMGELQTSKLVFSTFIMPLIFLVKNALIKRCNQTSSRAFCCFRGGLSMDTELAGIVMYLEIGFTFGLVVPYIMPLLCILFLSYSAMFHHAVTLQGIPVRYDTYPIIDWLVVSLFLGYFFTAWLLLDNNVNGAVTYAILLGMPFSAIAASFARIQQQRGVSIEQHDMLLNLLQNPNLQNQLQESEPDDTAHSSCKADTNNLPVALNQYYAYESYETAPRPGVSPGW